MCCHATWQALLYDPQPTPVRAAAIAQPRNWLSRKRATLHPTLATAPCRTKALEEQLAAAEAGRAQIEQQLAVAHSQLADSRALMDSTQVRAVVCPVVCTSTCMPGAGGSHPVCQAVPAILARACAVLPADISCWPLPCAVLGAQPAGAVEGAGRREGGVPGCGGGQGAPLPAGSPGLLCSAALCSAWRPALCCNQVPTGALSLRKPVQVSQLESELRLAATKHEAALADLRMQHQQASTHFGRSHGVVESATLIQHYWLAELQHRRACPHLGRNSRLRNAQEKEGLQAQIEAKEREVEAAQEAAEAAARATADRDRQLAGQADASADKVGRRWAWLLPSRAGAHTPLHGWAVTRAPPLKIPPLVVVLPPPLPQASQVERELAAARAEVGQIRQHQEAERARVKKAIAEMKRKLDGWAGACNASSCWSRVRVAAQRGPACCAT